MYGFHQGAHVNVMSEAKYVSIYDVKYITYGYACAYIYIYICAIIGFTPRLQIFIWFYSRSLSLCFAVPAWLCQFVVSKRWTSLDHIFHWCTFPCDQIHFWSPVLSYFGIDRLDTPCNLYCPALQQTHLTRRRSCQDEALESHSDRWVKSVFEMHLKIK